VWLALYGAAGRHHQPWGNEPANSIEIAISGLQWRAREPDRAHFSLLIVNGAKSWLTVAYPECCTSSRGTARGHALPAELAGW
jgi:hypothetical protein